MCNGSVGNLLKVTKKTSYFVSELSGDRNM